MRRFGRELRPTGWVPFNLTLSVALFASTAVSAGSVELWDPVSVLPAPPEYASPGDTSGGCREGQFGSPPRQASIEYLRTWSQTDTNANGKLDEHDEWGWNMRHYRVRFQFDGGPDVSCNALQNALPQGAEN